MIIRALLALAGAMAMIGMAVHGHATEQPPPAADLSVSQGLPVSLAAEATYQVQADQVRYDWRLDPAIFTDISPVNAPDIAIKLPADQREE